MSAKLARPQVSPTGLTLWPLGGDGHLSLIWCGTGSKLYMGLNATAPGGSMIPIDHPTARGHYQTRKNAARAALAFVVAADSDGTAE